MSGGDDKGRSSRWLRQWNLALLISGKKNLSPAAKHVALWLLDHRNALSGRCDPSIARLAEKTGLKERSVGRALAELENAGCIRRHLRPGTSSYYTFIEPAGFAGPVLVEETPPTKSSGVRAQPPTKSSGVHPRPNRRGSPDQMELRLPTVSSGKPEKEPEKEPCDAAGESRAAGDAWARVLADLSHDIDPTAYASWVLDLNFVGIVDGAAVIEAETAFRADWVRSRYADVIRRACARHFGSDRVTIRVRLSRTAAPGDIDAGALKRAR